MYCGPLRSMRKLTTSAAWKPRSSPAARWKSRLAVTALPVSPTASAAWTSAAATATVRQPRPPRGAASRAAGVGQDRCRPGRQEERDEGGEEADDQPFAGRRPASARRAAPGCTRREQGAGVDQPEQQQQCGGDGRGAEILGQVVEPRLLDGVT